MSQHPWVRVIEPKEAVKLLREARERLKTAWEWDQKNPNSYPINTSYALAEIHESLSSRPHDENRPVRIIAPKRPRSLTELVPEKLVKAIWEEHHTGTFRDAIRRAAGFDLKQPEKSWKVFQGIMRAIEIAYLVSYFGEELLPKPKVSILHRGLSDIAKAVGPAGQTEEDFAEFLNYLCPCGLRRHKEAVRKLSSRSARFRRPKA